MNDLSASPASRPSAGRPTREQAEARHGELLDTALDMFLERGFELTTMEGVAAAVGMTKRTVYARYADKAALFIATVQRAIQRSIIPENSLRSLNTSNLEQTLLAVARMRVANVMTPEGLRLQRIINAESYRFPEIFNMAYDQASRPVLDFLTELLRTHENAGAICVGRPDMAATAFMSMVVSGPVRFIVSGNPLSQQEIEDRMNFSIKLFLNGALSR